MAEPEANIFELIYQISQDGQKRQKREYAITEFLHLLKEQPEAAKQKDSSGWTPLHLACSKQSPFEVVAALLKAWPDAAKQKDRFGNTPLQMACRINSSFEVTFLLLNSWLSYKENRSKSSIMHLQRSLMPLHRYNHNFSYFNFTGDVKVLFSHLFALYNNDAGNPSPNEIMDYFVRIEMWNGVSLVLDSNPAVVKTIGLDTNAMADLLSTIGRCCSMITMWEVIRNEQDLLEGV
mmetsp:Transcript_6845/g.10379  ORF Transcript_6845/g.10379 Transcript_6845/m.10379 type:complete len:235 (-) Transcript_6845:193-897(-)